MPTQEKISSHTFCRYQGGWTSLARRPLGKFFTFRGAAAALRLPSPEARQSANPMNPQGL